MCCQGEDGWEEKAREPEKRHLPIDAKSRGLDHPPHLPPGRPVERLADGARDEREAATRHGEVRVHEHEEQPAAAAKDAAELGQRGPLVREPVECFRRHDCVEGAAAEREPAPVAPHPRPVPVPRLRVSEHPAREVAAHDTRPRKLAAEAGREDARAAPDVEHAPAGAVTKILHHGVVRPPIDGALYPWQVIEERPAIEEPALGTCGGHVPASLSRAGPSIPSGGRPFSRMANAIRRRAGTGKAATGG